MWPSDHSAGTSTVPTLNKSFADTASHWAKSDIELLASKLLVQGTTDTTFAPDQHISHAEFTALLARALGLPNDGIDRYLRRLE